MMVINAVGRVGRERESLLKLDETATRVAPRFFALRGTFLSFFFCFLPFSLTVIKENLEFSI